MGHKRYVIKNGKTYGPYLYESYRDKNGNVKKRYLGRDSDVKKGNNISIVVIMLLLMFLSLFMLVTLFFNKFF